MLRLHRILTLLSAITITALCLCACATLESPRVSLSSLALEKTTGFETVLQAQLRVVNPNDRQLDIRGVDCALDVNGTEVAYGVSNASVSVPAMGSTTVPITIYSSAVGIARAFAGVPLRGEARYRLKGKVRLDNAGWLLSQLPFKSEGEVTLKDLEAWLSPTAR